MRELSERVQGWVHTKDDKQPSIHELEDTMEPELAEQIYELDRCIECGCCVSACATKAINPNFISALGMLKITRFRLDPRDSRDDAQYYDILGNEDGIFGCMSLLSCEDNCPKDLPHAAQISFLRKKMLQV